MTPIVKYEQAPLALILFNMIHLYSLVPFISYQMYVFSLNF